MIRDWAKLIAPCTVAVMLAACGPAATAQATTDKLTVISRGLGGSPTPAPTPTCANGLGATVGANLGTSAYRSFAVGNIAVSGAVATVALTSDLGPTSITVASTPGGWKVSAAPLLRSESDPGTVSFTPLPVYSTMQTGGAPN